MTSQIFRKKLKYARSSTKNVIYILILPLTTTKVIGTNTNLFLHIKNGRSIYLDNVLNGIHKTKIQTSICVISKPMLFLNNNSKDNSAQRTLFSQSSVLIRCGFPVRSEAPVTRNCFRDFFSSSSRPA